MVSLQRFLLAFALIMTLIVAVLSLDCYVCDEETHPNCRDSVNSYFIKKCEVRYMQNSQQYPTACLKAFLEISEVFTISCYVCDEKDDPDCLNNLKDTFAQICRPLTNDGGIKAKGCTVSFVNGNGSEEVRIRVSRQCYYEDLNKSIDLLYMGCHDPINASYPSLNCSVCGWNLCNNNPINGASLAIQPMYWFLIGFLLFILIGAD